MLRSFPLTTIRSLGTTWANQPDHDRKGNSSRLRQARRRQWSYRRAAPKDSDSASDVVPNRIAVRDPTAPLMSPPGKPHFDWSDYYGPTGELKAATYTPT
ncbi:hypothetical protein ACVINW_004865 [Bradyrhizobium sp. USDA 4461]